MPEDMPVMKMDLTGEEGEHMLSMGCVILILLADFADADA